MKIQLSQIFAEYQKFTIGRQISLKGLYFDHFEKQAASLKIPFPKGFEFLDYAPKTDFPNQKQKQQLIDPFKKGEVFPFLKAEGVLQALLTKSSIALEKSVYFFLNYRYNREGSFHWASRQSEYYAEFFAVIALSRFLGLAITYVPLIGQLQTEVDWEKGVVNIKIRNTKHGGHLDQFNLLKSRHVQFDFLDDSIKEGFRKSDKFLLTSERISRVYEFGRKSNVFHLTGNKQGVSLCFLGGLDGESIKQIEIDSEDDSKLADFEDDLMDKYADWGYAEYNIGVYQKQVIDFLKSIGDSTRKFLKELSWNVGNIEVIDERDKVDILSWLQ